MPLTHDIGVRIPYPLLKRTTEVVRFFLLLYSSCSLWQQAGDIVAYRIMWATGFCASTSTAPNYATLRGGLLQTNIHSWW